MKLIRCVELEIVRRMNTRGELKTNSSNKWKVRLERWHQWMIQLVGVQMKESNVVILASTNRPWELDTAIVRRFEKRIYIPIPNLQARLEVFKVREKLVSRLDVCSDSPRPKWTSYQRSGSATSGGKDRRVSK
jgi:hypothetical protein